MTLKDLAANFVEQQKSRIGASLMRGEQARIGNPTDGTIFVTGGNFPPNKQVYVHFVTDGDVTSVIEALVGSYTAKELTYDRPVLVKKNDAGFYFIAELDPVEDAIYSEGIEEQDDQSPVYNRQLIEQCTVHPVAGSLIASVTSGMLGDVYFSGMNTGDFATGTVQDTSAANITEATTNGYAKGILVQINTATETLEYKQSSQFNGILTLQQAYKAGLLPAVDSTKELRGYLKWTKGATAFSVGDIWNVVNVSNIDTDATVAALGNQTGNIVLDIASGARQTLTLTGNTVITAIDNAPVGCDLHLLITQDGVGSHTLTFPASVLWAGGTAPTITTTAASVDLVVLSTFDSGTTWYGRFGQNFS